MRHILDPQQNRLIRKPEVLSITGLTSSSLYRLMEQGDFPQSISISERSVAWNVSDIDRWVETRINLSEIA
ncbi:MAG: AlpA family phage regulatory protein [Paraglaciecola sp.]|uniref:helix-turn-helix transcriptional regulator n=1 Tax=Paraglaciecola sp. TaxID=1920173 RepID=UPI003299C14A